MPTGRPTKYDPTFCAKAREIAKLGAIDAEIANILGVSEATLNNWKKEYPEFLESIKEGKDLADSKVTQSLFFRATGYSHSETYFDRHGEAHEVTKQYPPDTSACIFWLKNRKKEDWRDKQEHEHSGGPLVAVIRDKD